MTLGKDHPSYSYSFHLSLSHIDPVLLDRIQDPGPLSNYEYKQLIPFLLLSKEFSLFHSFHEISSWTTSSMVALN